MTAVTATLTLRGARERGCAYIYYNIIIRIICIGLPIGNIGNVTYVNGLKKYIHIYYIYI